jgi:2-phospho-L-lactate guanylyltransferase
VTRQVFVVPLRRFDQAKNRLRQGDVADVTGLARELATLVVRSCAPEHVIILSESSEISRFAQDLGVEVLESEATNLNGAVQNAYERLGARFERLIVVHGDLQNPLGLNEFDPAEGVTIVTDHRARGTNVLVVPTGIGFRFQYGESSAISHEREAMRCGVSCQVITDSPWRFDVDEPADLPRAHE